MNNVAFGRTKSYPGRPLFVADNEMVVRDTGRQIAWELLDSRYSHAPVIIEVTANADIDDTTIAVTALQRAIQQGEVLDFGLRPSFVVTVTGNEAIGQTDFGVTALPGPVRAGTILKFGTNEEVVVTADAAAGATALTVEALDTAVEAADTATVPAQRLFARVTEDAEEGAEEITVEALDVWINDGDVASLGSGLAGYQVKAGTCMDLIEAGDNAGKIVPSALNTGGVTAFCLLATNADSVSDTDAITGYGIIKSASVYENLLPEATGTPKVLNSTWKTELLARGGFWMFEQWADNSAS